MTADDARGLARLSDIRVFEQPLDRTAQVVVDLARSWLHECDGVGIQLLGEGGVVTRAATDSRTFDLDALQDELDDGPCLQSLRDGEHHDLEPITSDERWPRFAPSARGAGLIACNALPLFARGEHIGVLNLYAWPAVGFSGWDRQQCGTFADRASYVLASALAYERTQVTIAQLEAELAAIPAREPE